VVASHIRSLMLNHLSDVASTDQHTVKPWFDGKLDFSPVVEDFASKGYPLVGGRLDYLNKQPVAALVYQRAKHIINLFSWPDDRPDLKEALQTATLQGYHLIHWVQGGSNYWAVSDLNESELTAFVQLLESAIGG
jgi:anti-sigma factor RsiW